MYAQIDLFLTREERIANVFDLRAAAFRIHLCGTKLFISNNFRKEEQTDCDLMFDFSNSTSTRRLYRFSLMEGLSLEVSLNHLSYVIIT